MRSLPFVEFVVASTVMGTCACASVPRGAAAVDSVDVEGNSALSGSDIEEKMATASSPKFLGLFRGVVYNYELFDRNVLGRDMERIQRYYRARGYYDVRVRAGRVRYTSDSHVEILVEVEEGRPILVREARIEGLDGLPAKVAGAARRAMERGVRQGEPFEEEPFRKTEDAVKRALTTRGYAWAMVARRADLDLPGHYAELFFTVRPGPQATFGAIRIEGLGDFPEAPVRRALDLAPGEPYSTASLDAAQQAVLNVGTFSSVEIIPELAQPPPRGAVVPLLVRVQQQKQKSVLLGGGVEIDAIRTEAHLRAGWEHKNLFGGFRHFRVDLKPGLVLYPTRLPTFRAPTAVLPEERFRVELRQPGLFEARTNGVTSHELNAYPMLLASAVDPGASVLGYLEYKGALGLDRSLWKLLVAPTYNFQYDRPFAYQGPLDASLHGIAISYLDLLAHLDIRDDKLRPHKGVFIRQDVQLAGLGGDARDLRLQAEVRGYVPIARKVTLGLRTMVGFLFPFDYGDASRTASDNQQLVYLRGFFSGGPSSNRGYPLRSLGPHGAVLFFTPGQQADCAPGSATATAPSCAVPLGGLSVWETSIELRFPIAGPFGGSTFCDMSDVAAERASIRLNYPHLSCGLGLRYDTPIGPIRVDAGYRIPGAQVPKGVDPFTDGDPGAIYGLPVALSFGIGEAF